MDRAGVYLYRQCTACNIIIGCRQHNMETWTVTKKHGYRQVNLSQVAGDPAV
jgi:hypothetical protein